MDIKKIVYTAICLAVSLAIPQICYVIGIFSGSVFLPMHIGVIVTGFIAGPISGGLVGVLVPFICNIITQTPGYPMVYFLMVEISAFGFSVGYFYKIRKYGINASLILSQIVGRIFYAIAVVFALNVLKMPFAFARMLDITQKLISSIPGIIIQLIVIPPIVRVIEKSGLSSVYCKKDIINKKK